MKLQAVEGLSAYGQAYQHRQQAKSVGKLHDRGVTTQSYLSC